MHKRENNCVHTYKEFCCIYMYQKVYQDFGFCVLIKLKEQSNMDNPETWSTLGQNEDKQNKNMSNTDRQQKPGSEFRCL